MKLAKSCLVGLALVTSTIAKPAELFSGDIGAAESSQATAKATVRDVATVGYATMNGGTSGGKAGAIVTVSTLAELEKAAAAAGPAIIMVSGKIATPGKVRIGSNKSIIGKDSKAELAGVGLSIRNVHNVIVRNLKIHHVRALQGDAIAIQASTNVWIDHVDVSSDKEHGKDYFDGLIDATHAADFVTISNNYIHDHYKASLVGHSGNNGAEDTGHLRITFANNLWHNINSRAPSLRFGTVHVFGSFFLNVMNGINVRKGAQVLVEQNKFKGCLKPLYSVDSTGTAVHRGNDFGANVTATIELGTRRAVPYKYALPELDELKIIARATGNTLTF
ncbi:putative pectate lyase A [Venturia nashicola]|uniref:Putative pectate lyase A n=1 Tax=Venturia nashicola TaxID=86259 RepID=A0A4Z1PEJ8_9PEZI|nr:putative pectate lyase A [Venturia nashicola]TLD39126.1 putative pectate lyase A [Venturia nashicola]